MKFRTKPLIIEAEQFFPDKFPWPKPVYVTDIYTNGTLIETPKPGENPREFHMVDTPGEPLRTDSGDWIIKGLRGEFYPCKPDIFEKTYEPVDDWNRTD